MAASRGMSDTPPIGNLPLYMLSLFLSTDYLLSPLCCLLGAAMAIKSPTTTTTTTKACILFLLSSILTVALCKPGYRAQVSNSDLLLLDMELPSQGLNKEEMWRWKSKTARRLMIGSAAPTCTFNECRGCRFKCSAEQVPVDANDPMNSAYHYKCVCHR